ESSGWTRGMDAFYTKQATDIKFWMSVGVGLQIAVAIIGFYSVFKAFSNLRQQAKGRGLQIKIPKGRGDIALWIPVTIWLCVTLFYIALTKTLLNYDSKPGEEHNFSLGLLVFYGLIWSPINSYVSARMVGITGTGV